MGLKSKNKVRKKTKLAIIKIIFYVVLVLLLFLPKYVTLAQIQLYGLVTVLGIDKCGDNVKCTIEVVLPKAGGGPSGENIVITGEGLTMSTAIENLSIATGRQLSFSHCALLVIGEEQAKTWIMDELDYLLSSGKVSPEIALVISGNQTANEFVVKMSKFSQKLNLDSLLKYSDFGTQNYAQTLVRFIIDMKSRSETAVVPVLEMGDKAENFNSGEQDEDGKNIKDSQGCEEENQSSGGSSEEEEGKGGLGKGAGGDEEGGGGGGEEKPTIVKSSDKMAIFHKGRMVDVWDSKQSSGMAWLDKKAMLGIVFIQNIEIYGKKLKNLTCQLTNKKIRYKAKFINGMPVYHISLKLQFLLEERYKLYEFIGDVSSDLAKEVYPAILSELMAHISEELLEVLKSSRESGYDPMHIHDRFYKYQNKQYKQFIASGQNLLDKVSLEIDYRIELN